MRRVGFLFFCFCPPDQVAMLSSYRKAWEITQLSARVLKSALNVSNSVAGYETNHILKIEKQSENSKDR